MAITIVDSASAESNGTADISDSVATLGLTLVKDDVVIACISNNDAGNTDTINDNNGGAFIPITNRVQGNTYAHRCFFYVVGDTPLTTFAFDMNAYSGRMTRTYIQLRGANTTLPIQSVEVDTGTTGGVLPNPGRTQYLNTLALAFVTDDNVSTAGDDITGWTEYTELVEANGAAGQAQAAGYRQQPEPGLLKGETLTNTTLVATTVVINPANLIDVPDSSAAYYVGHSGTANSGPVTSVTHTHGLNIEPGDLILVAININQATPGNVTTITDNQSGTYPFTQCDNFPVNTNGTAVQSLWWRIAEAGEPTSYQFTHNGTADRMSIGTLVFRGVHPTSPFREFPDGANVSYDETASVFTTICDSAACNPQEMGVAVAWLDNGSGGSFGSVDNNFNFHDDTDFAGVNSIAWASRRVATNETGQTTFTGDSSSGRTGLQFSLVPKNFSKTGHHFVAGATAYDAANDNIFITPDFDIRKDDVLIAILHQGAAGNFANTEGDFTERFSEENPSAETSQIAFWERVCDGTENGKTWEFTIDNLTNGRFACHMLQFRGIDTRDIWEVAPSASTRGTVEPGTTLASPLTLTTTNPHTIALGVCTTDNDGVNYSGYPGGFGYEVGHGTGQGLSEVTQVLTSSGTQTVFNATASQSQNQIYWYLALKAAEQPYQYVRGIRIQSKSAATDVVTNSLSLNHTVEEGEGLALIAIMELRGTENVTLCAWDQASGTPLQELAVIEGTTTSDRTIHIHGLLNPDVKTANLVWNLSGSSVGVGALLVLEGVAGFGATASDNSTSANSSSLNLSTNNPNDWIIDLLAVLNATDATEDHVPGPTQELLYRVQNGTFSDIKFAASLATRFVGDGDYYSRDMKWDWTTADDMAHAAVVIKSSEPVKEQGPAIITRYANVNEPRRYHPQRGVSRIDWTNPLTEGLKFFGSFHEGFPYEYVKREHGIPGSAWRGMSPVDGVMAMTINDLDGRTNAVEFPKHDEIYAGISECTIMCFTRNRNSTVTAGQRPYGYMGTGNDPFYLSLGNDGNFVLVLLTTVSSYTSVGADYNVAGVEPDRWALWGGTWKNNTLTGRWQHRKDTSPTTTSGVMATPDANADNVPRVGSANVGGTNSWNGWVSFAAFWDRALTDAEWNSMVDDPWQVFHRRPIYIGKPDKRRVVTF